MKPEEHSQISTARVQFCTVNISDDFETEM